VPLGLEGVSTPVVDEVVNQRIGRISGLQVSERATLLDQLV